VIFTRGTRLFFVGGIRSARCSQRYEGRTWLATAAVTKPVFPLHSSRFVLRPRGCAATCEIRAIVGRRGRADSRSRLLFWQRLLASCKKRGAGARLYHTLLSCLISDGNSRRQLYIYNIMCIQQVAKPKKPYSLTNSCWNNNFKTCS